MCKKLINKLLTAIGSPFVWLYRAISGSKLAQRFFGMAVMRFVFRVTLVVWQAIRRSVKRVRRFLGDREVAFWIITWLACVMLARGVLVLTPAKVASSVFALIVLAYVAGQLYAGIIILMVLLASFFQESIIPYPFTLGGFGVGASEMLIIFMLVVLLLRCSANKRFEFFSSPVTIPLILLAVSVLLAMYVGYLRQSAILRGMFDFGIVYGKARPMIVYLIFFVVAFGLQNMRQVKFVFNIMVVISALMGLLMAVQYIVGPSHSLFPGTASIGNRVELVDQDITRSLPPGLFTMPFLFFGASLMACNGDRKSRIRYGIAATAIGAGLVFSFTRNLWFFTLFSIFVTWLLSGRALRRKLSILGAFILCASIIGSTLMASLAPGRAGSGFVKAVTKRFTSALDKKEFKGDSFQNRLMENGHAIDNIKQNPIFGIGLGSPFAYLTRYVPPYKLEVIVLNIMHNSYLELWMVYGLLGVISFAWLTIVVLVRSYVLFRRSSNPEVKAISLAVIGGSLVYLPVATMAMTYLHTASVIFTTATMWGLLEALWRLDKQEDEKPAIPASRPKMRLLAPRCEGLIKGYKVNS